MEVYKGDTNKREGKKEGLQADKIIEKPTISHIKGR